MKIKDSEKDNIVIFDLSGKIMGGDEAALFHGKIHEYLDQNKKQFVLNMKNIDWTNSLGLGMLIAGHSAVNKAEGRLVLANITNIENILAITRLIRVFEAFDSLDEALAAFKSDN